MKLKVHDTLLRIPGATSQESETWQEIILFAKHTSGKTESQLNSKKKFFGLKTHKVKVEYLTDIWGSNHDDDVS